MNNKEKIILDLCGGTGAWSKPYKDAGYTVYVISLPEWSVGQANFEAKEGWIEFWRGDYSLMVPIARIHGILAAPPCTMFSMARSKAKTPRDLKAAMKTVQDCLQIIWKCQYSGKRLQFWAMENPKGRLRWFMGHPALTFNPYDFGDAYRKPTDIWGYFNTNLKKNVVALDPKQDKQSRLNLQELQPIPVEYVRDPNMSPRAIARSITHTGFAQAFFKANQ